MLYILKPLFYDKYLNKLIFNLILIDTLVIFSISV